VAPDVLKQFSGLSPALNQEPLRSMNRDFQIRFTAGLLILLTTAAVVLAWINFQKEAEFQIPSDGVWWMEQTGGDGGLIANRVERWKIRLGAGRLAAAWTVGRTSCFFMSTTSGSES